MAVLVDTGILYALADADDAWHARAVEWTDEVAELLIVPVTVLPEVAYLLPQARRRRGARVRSERRRRRAGNRAAASTGSDPLR